MSCNKMLFSFLLQVPPPTFHDERQEEAEYEEELPRQYITASPKPKVCKNISILQFLRDLIFLVCQATSSTSSTSTSFQLSASN